MRKMIMALMLILVLLAVFVPFSSAEMAEDKTDSSTNYFTATAIMAPLDKERFALTYENLGVIYSDTGQSLFHNMSSQNIGVSYFDKGKGMLLGYMVMTDFCGDKVFVEIKEDKILPPPNSSKGIGKFIGGTGKFAGIEGTMEYSRYYLNSAKKDTYQGVVYIKSHCKLP